MAKDALLRDAIHKQKNAPAKGKGAPYKGNPFGDATSRNPFDDDAPATFAARRAAAEAASPKNPFDGAQAAKEYSAVIAVTAKAAPPVKKRRSFSDDSWIQKAAESNSGNGSSHVTPSSFSSDDDTVLGV